MNDSNVIKKVLVMIDLENLSLEPSGVVTEIGMVVVDDDDHESLLLEFHEYMPIQPQLDMGRTILASTLLWWMTQPEATRGKMQNCAIGDSEVVENIMRGFVRKLSEVIQGRDYTIMAQGPQMDLVQIESLLKMTGFKVPWSYNRVADLRTILQLAPLTDDEKESVRPVGCIDHNAYWDARKQINYWALATTKLRRVQ